MSNEKSRQIAGSFCIHRALRRGHGVRLRCRESGQCTSRQLQGRCDEIACRHAVMTCDRTTYGKRHSRHRDNEPVRNEVRRQTPHQCARKKKSVESAANYSNDSSHALAKRRVVIIAESFREDVTVHGNDCHDRGDGRDLGEQAVADGAEPPMSRRRRDRCGQGCLTVNGTEYSRSSQANRRTPPDPCGSTPMRNCSTAGAT